MNAENPVQIDLFGVSATRTKDTRLAEHIGGDARTQWRPGQSLSVIGSPVRLAGPLGRDHRRRWLNAGMGKQG